MSNELIVTSLDKKSIDEDDRLLSGMLELDNIDRLILRYITEYPSFKMSRIAKMLDMKETYLRHRVRKPAFQHAQRILEKTTDKLLIDAAKQAAAKLLELIDHPNPMISLGAVKVALTRHLSQKIEPTTEEIIGYKTTIAADGQLLQNVIREELENGYVVDVESK